jgi:hypothetical protein
MNGGGKRLKFWKMWYQGRGRRVGLQIFVLSLFVPVPSSSYSSNFVQITGSGKNVLLHLILVIHVILLLLASFPNWILY